jgi:hypothetical protein
MRARSNASTTASEIEVNQEYRNIPVFSIPNFLLLFAWQLYYCRRNNILSGERIMKKHLLSLTLIFVWMAAVLLLPQQACADPPQDLLLSYDMKAETLSVSITHKSTFTGFHYIKQVQIKRNDEPFETQKYESQPGKKTFIYTYKVPAKPNDLLEVTATCNVQGRKTATLKVE